MVSKFFPIEFGHLCGVQQKWHLCDLRPRLVHPWVLEPAYNYSWEPTVHISSQLCVQQLKIGHSGSNDTMEISKYYKSGHFHPGRQLLNISQHTAASSPGSLVMLTLRSQPPRCEEPEHPVEKLMWRETKAPWPSALSELPANSPHPLASHMTEPSNSGSSSPQSCHPSWHHVEQRQTADSCTKLKIHGHLLKSGLLSSNSDQNTVAGSLKWCGSDLRGSFYLLVYQLHFCLLVSTLLHIIH